MPYGKHGPRYVLDPDGTVRRDGNFEGLERTYSPAEAELRWQFGKSAIYRLLADRPPRPTEDDVRTTLAIVRRSRDLLVEQYEVQEVFLIVAFCIGEAAALVTGLIDYAFKNSLHVSERFVSLE